ncbi:uncharacterized protein LOC125504494 isoform X2 [Dendroctonus ponderosae]|uniref:uncharacterized protein LOC125504494 isoform X2 n=1 Tax=Dendroctonus ponderosae TaxID=77166 RepID=UPI00203650B3|nr:uncharacterized protein LOC125504494 isoform X2 [Dendroctonus ponderosae]XP_048522559.1 uncharacterized protein LOC125504494 isoform X2 [Dendroctonus ponderosae]
MSSEKLLLESTTMSWYPPDIDEEETELILSLSNFIHFFMIASWFVRLFSLSGNIYLIVVIARLKPPKTHINVIILLYVTFSCMYLIFNLVALYSDTIFFVRTFGLERFTEILMNFTLIFLALSWYVPNYYSELYSKFPFTFKYGVGLFFLLVSLGIAVFSIVFHDILNLIDSCVYVIADVTCLTVCCLMLLSFTILRLLKKPLPAAHKTAYAFSIPQVLLAMSAASTLICTLLTFEKFDHYYRIYLTLDTISVYLYICEPIVLLFMLGRSSKDFRMAQLKCCRKNMRNYDNNDLESNSGSETAENNVTFHRSSDNIRL